MELLSMSGAFNPMMGMGGGMGGMPPGIGGGMGGMQGYGPPFWVRWKNDSWVNWLFI